MQALQVGQWWFVGWPGEIFVEHALAVKAAVKDTFVISLANGELQGYVVTEDAAREGGYEASNAIFAPAAGRKLVETTLALLNARPEGLGETPSTDSELALNAVKGQALRV